MSAGAASGGPTAAPSHVFDIPRVIGVSVDGSCDDWGKSGLLVPVLAPVEGNSFDPGSYDIQLRLGWNDRGLLVLATVKDDIWSETSDGEDIYNWDCLELFLGDRVGGTDVGQWMVSMGMDAEPAALGKAGLRAKFNDQRKTAGLKGTPDGAKFASKALPGGGCVLEAELPWSMVGVKPAAGKEVGFQIFANDRDDDRKNGTAIWHPVFLAPVKDSNQMCGLRLSDKASAITPVRASARYDVWRCKVFVSVTARDVQGQALTVVCDGKTVGEAAWPQRTGLVQADVAVQLPPVGKEYGPATVLVDGKPLATCAMPAVSKERATDFVFGEVRGYPAAVFSGTRLPDVDFTNIARVEQTIGRYQKKVTYYDSNYNVVQLADKPGRYGAVMEVTTADGRNFRRFVTLFRIKTDVPWWDIDVTSVVKLPEAFGADPAAVQADQAELSQILKWRALEHTQDDALLAIVLAGLVGNSNTKIDFYSNCLQQDRRWWLGLKRKLYGWDKQFTKPVALPVAASRPAPALREGTPEQAGMMADGVKKIDDVCQAWAADSDQAFSVCIARHGVIVLHKAYGQRDGKDLTVDDKSRMASLSKFIFGVAFLQLIDQGYVKLSDDAATYLPPLGRVKLNRPMTVHHLFTHTSGFKDWHWGDEEGDAEERLSAFLPHIKVGAGWDYNGTGLALAGKVLEAISGKTLPDFYREHLFGPLGCTSTELGDTSHGARSTAIDMARIGQLVLNRGSYGERQFFRPETTDNLLAKPLGDLCPSRAADVSYGMGCVDYPKEPLGPNTYGHGAASSAILRVSFDHDLVVSQCRNSAGRNYEKYKAQFLRAIAEAVAKER